MKRIYQLLIAVWCLTSSYTTTTAASADWMKNARFGVMHHFLADWISKGSNLKMTPEVWNGLIDHFDVQGLANQLDSTGAGYCIISIGQNSGYYMSPNKTYDQFTKIKPSKCSNRDLVADLADALQKKGIRLIVYLPSGAPAGDSISRNALEWQNGPYPNVEFQRKWEAIIREWSLRWGSKVSGWWFDGCYWPNTLYRSSTPPNFESFSAAAKAGNPQSLVAYNPGVVYRTLSVTPYEDYIGGEIDDLSKLSIKRVSNGLIDGKQLHILSYLGERWGMGNPRYDADRVIAWSKQLWENDGAITWDIPIQNNGLLRADFMEQIKAVGAASKIWSKELKVEKISEDAGIHTDLRPIPVGFYSPEVNKTFLSWMGSYSHPIIKEFDHTTKKWSADKIIGESPFADKHNYPGMIRGADNHLYVFYGCHNSTLKMTRSPEPLSIEGDWQDVFIKEAPGASYPAPIVTKDGTLYVFYRNTRQTNKYSDDRPYEYVKSTDNGKTWIHNMAIDNYPRPDNFNEIYNGKVSYQPAQGTVSERIHLSWTICGGGVGKHAHATYGTNAYYAYLSTANQHFYNIQGVDLGTYIDNDESDKYCMVANLGYPKTGHLAGLEISVHYMDSGLPIVFHNVPGKGYGCSTWTGKLWTFTPISNQETETREISKLDRETFRVYITRGSKVLVYRSENGGHTWDLENTIEFGQTVSKCNEITNYHPDVRLMVSEIKNDNKNVKESNRDIFIVKESK
ncbi:MAG TPA: BNR-4 repeat-containing protein [Bacteroidales bacterium]|nr:BNR-4 repeat-containing protein [Bacteroidales bacterium]